MSTEEPPSPTVSSIDDDNYLPSPSTSSDSDDEQELSEAEREWRESLQQLELLLTMVIVPYAGKYYGRKAAYWSTLVPLLLGISTN